MAGMDQQLTVRKNEQESRYEAYFGEELAGFADYEIGEGTVSFPHTVTQPEFGGRGVASQLARHSLEDVRSQGLKAVPVCAFYVGYVKKHPEFQDLL